MSDPSATDALERVVECLSRNIGELNWIEPLKMHSEKTISGQWAAIGFDTNAIKKLRRYPADARTSILMYLQSKSVPIILPAQSVQEYWNNHDVFAKQVEGIENDTRKLAARYHKMHPNSETSDLLAAIAEQVSSIAEDIADSKNPNLLRESIELWESLLPNALVSHVPRQDIMSIGEARFSSGVAPGFADSTKRANKLGDFFVWADFLLGLSQVDMNENDDSKAPVVFVTDDAKEDWLSAGVPHPTLLGEVFALTSRPLSIFGMDELRRVVSE